LGIPRTNAKGRKSPKEGEVVAELAAAVADGEDAPLQDFREQTLDRFGFVTPGWGYIDYFPVPCAHNTWDLFAKWTLDPLDELLGGARRTNSDPYNLRLECLGDDPDAIQERFHGRELFRRERWQPKADPVRRDVQSV